MHILQKSALFTLLALFAVGGVIALSPSDTSAQEQNCGCDIQITQVPSSAEVGVSTGPFTIEVECYQSQYQTYSLENQTDGEYILGPTTYNDEGLYTFSSNHTFSSSGSKQLQAQVQAVGKPTTDPSGCDWYEADTDSVSVSTGFGGPTMDVSIDGPSSVNLSEDSTKTYTAYFDWTGDEVRYRFHVNGSEYIQDWQPTTANSADKTIDWNTFGADTHQICVDALSREGDTFSSAPDTACMPVDVDEGQDAVLEIRSQNPNSGVGMDFAGNSTHFAGQHFETYREFNRNGDIDVRVYAEGTNQATGNTFDGWSGCDSEDGDGDRACNITVIQGNTRTITATYAGDFCQNNPDDPDCNDDDDDDDDNDPSPGSAKLNVYSTNPSSGVAMDVTTGNLPSDFRTPEAFSEGSQITATIWAYPYEGNNVFEDWEGCDYTADRRCDISVNVGGAKTITANYRGSDTPPDRAIIYVESTDPSSGVKVDAAGGYGGGSENNLHDVNHTPGEINKDYNLKGRLFAESPAPNGNVFEGWNGCDSASGNACDISVNVGGAKTIVADYRVHVPPAPPTIDNFSLANDPDIDFSANPPELHVDDQPFELIWSTSNANSVTGASSESTQWPGGKSLDGSEYINEGSIPGTSKTFNYSITAHSSSANDSESLAVTLLDPPSFDLSSEAETDIDGEPGSMATVQVEVTSRKYSGDCVSAGDCFFRLPNAWYWYEVIRQPKKAMGRRRRVSRRGDHFPNERTFTGSVCAAIRAGSHDARAQSRSVTAPTMMKSIRWGSTGA